MDDLLSLSTSTNKVLQPFLQMARDTATTTTTSANISTIRTLVLKVLSHAEIFVGFDQIKEIIQPCLSSADGGDILLNTLDLFSYGTYNDYINNKEKYLQLSDGQILKLRQLTTVTLVQNACINNTNILPYGLAAKELGFDDDTTTMTTTATATATSSNDVSIESLRLIEDIIISCIYSRIISGQLCQKEKTFIITSSDGHGPCRSRDVHKDSIDNILQSLKDLQERLSTTKDNLADRSKSIETFRNENDNYWKQVTKDNTTTTTPMELLGASTAATSSAAYSVSSSSGRREGGVAPSRQTKRSRGGFGGFSGLSGGFLQSNRQ